MTTVFIVSSLWPSDTSRIHVFATQELAKAYISTEARTSTYICREVQNMLVCPTCARSIPSP